MAKKFPPNPLPCGCGAKGIYDLENAIDDGYVLNVGFKDIHVVHCPLHGAAPELLAALKEYLNAGHKEARRLASIKAKAAIAKAGQ